MMQARPVLQAEIAQLDAAAEVLAHEKQAAGQTLEKVQVHLRVQHAVISNTVHAGAIQSSVI